MPPRSGCLRVRHIVKDGQEPASAFDRSMKQNFDGTERCAEKINAEFKKFDMPAPFE